MHSPYGRRESFSNRFESDDSDIIRVLPFSRRASVKQQYQRYSQPYSNPYLDPNPTPKRAAPSAPISRDVSHSSNPYNIYESPSHSHRNKYASKFINKSFSGTDGVHTENEVDQNSMRAERLKTGYTSGLDMRNDWRLTSNQHSNRNEVQATVDIRYGSRQDNFDNRSNSYGNGTVSRYNDNGTIMRRDQNTTQALHEELLRVESQKEDALLQTEKLQLQLSLQKDENSKLEKMISNLRLELANAGKQAKNAVIDQIENQLQNHTRSVAEQINSNMSNLRDFMYHEIARAPTTVEISKKMETVNANQEKQTDLILVMYDKLNELYQETVERQSCHPIAMENIQRLKQDLKNIASNDLATLETTIKNLENDIVRIKSEFEIEQINIQEKTNEMIESLLNERGALVKQVEILQNENNILIDQNDRLKIEVRRIESRADHYMKLANHASEIAELKQKSISSTTMDEKVERADITALSSSNFEQEKLTLLQSENKRLLSYQDELSNQLKSMTNQRDRLKYSLQELEEESKLEYQRLEKEIQQLQEELRTVTKPNELLERKIHLLETEIEKKEVKIEYLTQNLNKANEQASQLTHQMQDTNGEHAKKISILQNQIQAYKRDLDNKEQQILRLQKESNRQRDEEKRLRELSSKQVDTINRLQTQMELMKTEKVQEAVSNSIKRQSLTTRGSNLRTPLRFQDSYNNEPHR